MVSVSHLESILCKPNVGLLLVTVLPGYRCLIDYVSVLTITLHGAIVFNSAVASSFLADSFILFVDNFVVVGGYYRFDIWRARVAYFHGVSIE